MSKKHILEEGQIYAIPLSDGSFTVAQLVNHHPLKGKLSEDTFAFFNYKFSSIDEIERSVDLINYDKPFSIVTTNSAIH